MQLGLHSCPEVFSTKVDWATWLEPRNKLSLFRSILPDTNPGKRCTGASQPLLAQGIIIYDIIFGWSTYVKFVVSFQSFMLKAVSLVLIALWNLMVNLLQQKKTFS